MTLPQFQIQFDPFPNPEAVVSGSNVRFSLLTERLIRRRKRRREMAELLQALLNKHPTGTVFVAWDNFSADQDDKVEEVVRSAAGRLVLLYLPNYSHWLNPIEMLWRHFRREVTHCELFENIKILIELLMISSVDITIVLRKS